MYGQRRPTRKPVVPPTDETDALVVNNMGLVKPCARRYAGITGIDYDDLQSAGYVGLIRASRAFDPARGCKFSTIAVRYIQGAILQYIRDNGYGLKFPRRWRDKASRVRGLASQQELTIDQIAEQTELRPAEVSEILDMMKAAEATEDLCVPTDDPGITVDDEQTIIALRALAQHAYEAVGAADQALLLELHKNTRWPTGAVQKFDAYVVQGLNRQTLRVAAKTLMLNRLDQGLKPFRFGSLSVAPDPNPVSLEGRRLRAQRAEEAKRLQADLMHSAGESPSAEPLASSAIEDRGGAGSAGAAPTPPVPSAPLPPAEGTAGKPPGRGRRSRRATSTSARSQAAGSSPASAEDRPSLPDLGVTTPPSERRDPWPRGAGDYSPVKLTL